MIEGFTREQMLKYELNKSGQYVIFKERLKPLIVKLLREHGHGQNGLDGLGGPNNNTNNNNTNNPSSSPSKSISNTASNTTNVTAASTRNPSRNPTARLDLSARSTPAEAALSDPSSLRTLDLEQKQARWRLMSDLHALIQDHLVTALNKNIIDLGVMNNEKLNRLPKMGDVERSEYLLIRAREEEMLGNFDTAEAYLIERLSLDPAEPLRLRDDRETKVDYPVYQPHPELAQRHHTLARFYLNLDDDRMSDAETQLKEALSVDETNIPALLDLAALLLERRDTSSAHVFIQAVIDIAADTPLAYGLRALYYEHLDEGNYDDEAQSDWKVEYQRFQTSENLGQYNDELTDSLSGESNGHPTDSAQDLTEAKEVHSNKGIGRGGKDVDQYVQEAGAVASWREAGSDEFQTAVYRYESIRCVMANYLVSVRCLRLAELLLDQDETDVNGGNRSILARLALRVKVAVRQGETTRVDQAVSQVSSIALDDGQIADVFAMHGLSFWKQGNYVKASELFDRYLAWQPEPPALDPLVLWRRGLLYAQAEEYSQLKPLMLQLCGIRPCASAWLQVSISAINAKEYDDARKALIEANFIDSRNAQVWGYLALLQLLTDQESDQAFHRALALNLADAGLLIQIAKLYLREGFLQASEEALRTSIDIENTAEARLLLGHVHGHNRLLELQLAEYEKALELAGEDQDMNVEIEAAMKSAIDAQR